MIVNFEKWHGCRNDFIVVWNRNDSLLEQSLVKASPRLCRRDGSGISADGVLILGVPPGGEAPNTLIIVNSDGSIAQTCGNGIRCAARSFFRNQRKQGSTPESLTLRLENTEVNCRFLGKGATPMVAVEMGTPVLNRKHPLYNQGLDAVANLKTVHSFDEWGIAEISNHHLVGFSQEDGTQVIGQIGPALQKSEHWDGINVHIAIPMEVTDQIKTEAGTSLVGPIGDGFEIAIWERGAGRTQACGSGACSVAALAFDSGLYSRDSWMPIKMPGGTVFCQQAEADDPVTMAGPATFVFEGKVEI